MSGPYDDIMDLPHPISSRHPHMSASNRAAQFAPFAALTGYDSALRETARLTEQKTDLSDDAKALLDQKQQVLLLFAQQHPDITVTYFKPDSRKAGGAYISVSGQFQRIDPLKRLLFLGDKTCIPLDDILDLESATIDFSAPSVVW